MFLYKHHIGPGSLKFASKFLSPEQVQDVFQKYRQFHNLSNLEDQHFSFCTLRLPTFYADRNAAISHLVGKAMTVHALQSRELDDGRITRGAFGKPLHAQCSFNVSHTADLVAGVFVFEGGYSWLKSRLPSPNPADNKDILKTKLYQIGIDVLEADGRLSEAVVRKRFSELERDLVRRDARIFSKIWTVKEAYLKAILECRATTDSRISRDSSLRMVCA